MARSSRSRSVPDPSRERNSRQRSPLYPDHAGNGAIADRAPRRPRRDGGTHVIPHGGCGVERRWVRHVGLRHEDDRRITTMAAELSGLTARPYGMNLLLFLADDPTMTQCWPHALPSFRRRARDSGALVMYMVSTPAEAIRAAEAGADVIVAQGTEAGGYAGLINTVVSRLLVVRAEPQLPMLAAGGDRDGLWAHGRHGPRSGGRGAGYLVLGDGRSLDPRRTKAAHGRERRPQYAAHRATRSPRWLPLAGSVRQGRSERLHRRLGWL